MNTFLLPRRSKRSRLPPAHANLPHTRSAGTRRVPGNKPHAVPAPSTNAARKYHPAACAVQSLDRRFHKNILPM